MTDLPSGSTKINNPKFTAPASTLEEIKENLGTGDILQTEKRGRGRPKGSTGKKETVLELQNITPEMIQALMGFVSYGLNKTTRSEVWGFTNEEEKNMFCGGLATYLNLRLPNALGKFAPEITLALILTGYAVPRITQLKQSRPKAETPTEKIKRE